MAKRREKGDGSIYQRSSDGMYVAYARVPGTGKKKYVYDKIRSGVAKKLKDLQKKIDQGTLITAKAETVEAYMRYWLDIHKAKLKPASYVMYNSYLTTCLKHIGAINLQKLTGAHLQEMYTELAKTYKPHTICTIHSVIKTALKAAVRWRRLVRNPCDEMDAPTAQHEKRPFLNARQSKILLQAAQNTPIECILMMALTTGMRRGEMLALRWADIDMEQKYVSVQRTASYTRIPGGTYGFLETSPKTKASQRSIHLTDFLIAALKVHKKKQLEMRLQTGQGWANKDLVFCNSSGDYFSLSTLTTGYKKLLKENGLPQLHIHDLRHSTYALLASMGVPAKVIQEILGHSSIVVTQNLYGHVVPEMQDEAMEKMDNLFRKEG